MELTDLEICKRIAEIEGISNPSCDGSDIYANVGDDDLPIWGRYNPLTDDALCFQLMVKYKVWTSPSKPFTTTRAGLKIIQNASVNKAICLAIIEANKPS